MDKTITGIVTWLKQWFYTKEEIDSAYADSGWKDVTFQTGYTNYGTTEHLQYRKVGKLVEIRGVWKPTTTQTATSTATTFATIPEGYRPNVENVYVLGHGSQLNKWSFRVTTGGLLQWERYSTTSNNNMPSGAWMCTHIIYYTD